jgi:hypothetical protein
MRKIIFDLETCDLSNQLIYSYWLEPNSKNERFIKRLKTYGQFKPKTQRSKSVKEHF